MSRAARERCRKSTVCRKIATVCFHSRIGRAIASCPCSKSSCPSLLVSESCRRVIRIRQLLLVVALFCLGSATALVAVAAVPFSVLRPLGELVRRVDDVTPDRHARLIHVCLALAAWNAAAGALLWRRRNEAAGWLSQLTVDARSAWSRLPGAIADGGWAPWIVAAIGVALRAMHLNDSMAYDESYTFVNLARQPVYVGIADYTSTNNHLLNTLLMHGSWRFFGDAEWALRLPVFVVGSLFPLLVWVWAKRWLGKPIGLIAMALVAVSPFLVTYSTDARGYMLVAFAAIALDDAAARLFDPRSSRPLAMLQLVLAAALGLCAMPIMLYALVAVAGWMLLWSGYEMGSELATGMRAARTPASLEKPGFFAAAARVRSSLAHNRWPLLAGLLAFCGIVGLMYAPAYIFRGTRAMQDQILEKVSLADQARAQWDSLRGAWDWWTTGFPPAWAWGLGLSLAVLFFRSTRADRIRWAALPVSMLMLHLVGQVAPPPRVYILVLPHVAVAAAAGWIALASRRGPGAAAAGIALSAGVLIGGSVYAMTHPVLIYPAERTSFVSVREALLELKRRLALDTQHPHRLIAPLPCDLPSVFYREREGIAVEVNGEPRPGEVVWLLTRHGETPDEVLRSPLIQLPDLTGQRPPFEQVATFQTLILHRSPPRQQD